MQYLGKATAAATAALSIPNSACGIFMCPNNGMTANVRDLLTCTQMLMHAIAQGSCENTVRESALKFDSGGKTPAPLRN